MVKATKGFRRETRRRLSKKVREKFSISKYMRKFKVNDKVVIDIDPSSHRGMPFPKFQGRVGTIREKRGSSYMVEIRDGRKSKYVIAAPEHLRIKRG